MARTEVVDREPDTHRRQPDEDLSGPLRIAHDAALGYLELQTLRLDTALAEQLGDLLGEIRVEEIAHGKVDRDAQPRSFVLPPAGLLESEPQDLHRHRLDQARVLCDRDELTGTHEPPHGVLPPHESFEPVD